MEEIVEVYRSAASWAYEKLQGMSNKEAKRKARADITVWVNATTQCEFGYSAIHFACFHGDPYVLRLLVQYNAKVDVKNKTGLSPMHLAAKADLSFPLTFLKERGVDVDCVDD